MTIRKRWLDELPLGSSERELLLVGKSARPAAGAIDATWQALSVALAATAVSSLATSSVVTKSVSAKVGTSIALGKATSAGLLVAAAKSLAVGAVVGFTVMGAGAVVERVSQSDERPRTVVKNTQPPSAARASAASLPGPNIAPPGAVAIAPVGSVPGATPVLPAPGERSTVSSSAPNPGNALSAAPIASATDKSRSLSQQARELAELKRLIDNGATGEALRRLDTNFEVGTGSVLSEERDALYVQALDRAQRRAEARFFAQQFLARYPHSPYFETMRRLLAKE
jgi:hypothetical protein